MPPQCRVDQRIARLHLRHLGGGERLGKARMTGQIGRIEIDRGNHLSRWRQVERTGIEIGDLIGREQREAPMPDQRDGDVVRHVVMRGCSGPIADPDADQRRVLDQLRIAEGQRGLRAEARQILIDIGGADIDGLRIGIVQAGEKLVEIA